MRLVPVGPVPEDPKKRVSVLCCVCRRWTPEENAYADLTGEPFRAYYCEPCAREAHRRHGHTANNFPAR